MAHTTRSGKAYKYVFTDQSSSWGEASEVLLVLLDYLDFSCLLKGRQVCQAWRGSFSGPVKQLQLEQPASSRTALSLGRKACAAFINATTVRLRLLKVQDPPIDLTADDDDVDSQQPKLFGPDSLGRPAAGAALLRQLSKCGRLQQLQLVADISQTCTCLPALLKAAPQLLVLDLTCCTHLPGDLLVLAQHAPKLQELLLHCQAFTTLSGRRIRHGNQEWGRHGGNTRYLPVHLAALAHQPQLQLLECPLPPTYEDMQQAKDWFTAVGSLTNLTALHVIRHATFDARPPATAVAALSRLTRLRELRCEAGGFVEENTHPGMYYPSHEQVAVDDERAQAECWRIVLPCMPHLTRLELVEAAAGDALLCAIGSNVPQLQRLVLQREVWLSGCSNEGADAIAHVSHIELLTFKAMECRKNLQLLQLPGVKRIEWRGYTLPASGSSDMQGGSVWTQETCGCQKCLYKHN